MTQPQSRSDHVPGKTTTPNFKPGFRLFGAKRAQSVPGSGLSGAKRALSTIRLDVEPVVLDDVVGQQLPAHRVHPVARLALAAGLQPHLDVLAHAHVRHLAE